MTAKDLLKMEQSLWMYTFSNDIPMSLLEQATVVAWLENWILYGDKIMLPSRVLGYPLNLGISYKGIVTVIA